jgi:iron complex transport system substrate-binding protein
MRNIYFCLFSLFIACQPNNSIKDSNEPILIKEAVIQKHFSIQEIEDYFIVEINTPFVDGDFTERYVVYPKSGNQPILDSVTHYIPFPVESIAVTSTTHIGFLSAINSIDKIKASNNIDWAFSNKFHDLVDAGEINSIGNRNINQESLIAENVDLVLSYAIDISNYKEIKRLRELGQTVVIISEFMESDPINKASWLKVIALMLNKKVEADQFLENVTKRYDSLKHVSMYSSQASSVIMGFPWKGTWYMSGGKSFQSKLFADASSYYLWADNDKKSGIPLDIEEVINKGLNADVWVNTNSINRLNAIKESDTRFSEFKAFKSGRVYNYNLRVNEAGGNDYWESGVVRPDLVLQDLIKIFHPITLKDVDFTFYQKLP